MVALSLLFALTGLAYAEPVLTHHGRALDGHGMPVEGAVDVQVRLYDQLDSPTPFWDRTFPDVAMQQGYYSLTLLRDGQDRPLDSGALADGETWLDITIGTQTSARQRVGSTPHTLSVAPTLATAGQSCTTVGVLAYDAATHAVLACDGSVFAAFGGGSSPSVPIASCDEMAEPGPYVFSPPTGDDFPVWCDRGPDNLPMTLVASFGVTSEALTQIDDVTPESTGTLIDTRYQAILAAQGPSELVVAGASESGMSYARTRELDASCWSQATSAVPRYAPNGQSQYAWAERTGCAGEGTDYSLIVTQNNPNALLVYGYGSYGVYDYWQGNDWGTVSQSIVTVGSGLTRFYAYVRPLE